MKVVYDCVYGDCWASGVTDMMPNMLQVSRARPGQDEGQLIWRRLKGERFAPYWQGNGSRQTPLSIEEAVVLIKQFKKTLRRKDGTLVVQFRPSGVEDWLFNPDETFLISIAHTTKRFWETTNPSHPDGFPTRLR